MHNIITKHDHNSLLFELRTLSIVNFTFLICKSEWFVVSVHCVGNWQTRHIILRPNQGAGKRPRQCCHPKGGNGAEGPKGPRTKGTATRGPEGPESGQNTRVRGPEGPEDEQS